MKVNNILGFFDRGLIYLKSKWMPVKRGGAILIIALWIALIAYSAWVNTVDPTGFGLLDEEDRLFWAKFGPISALLLVLMKSLWAAVRSDGSLRHILVSERDQTDMKQMALYMQGADDVIIYSGDFSYIYDNDRLYEIFDDLSARENLLFISYKSKETVSSRSEERRNGKECLVERLISTNKILFDVPGRAKFSLAYRRGEEVLLYRHREEGLDYVTVFIAKDPTTKQLVGTIKQLVDTVVKSYGKHLS